MPCDYGERCRDCPVRDRYSRICRYRDRRCHARNDLIIHAAVEKQHALFTAAPEHEGIATLEADDRIACFGLIHEQLADIILVHRMMSRLLADVYKRCIWSCKAQYALIYEVVIYDYIGLFEALCSL